MEKKTTKTNQNKSMSRRDFLMTAGTGLAGFMILPSFTIDGKRIAPSDRVVLGFVGLGQQGCSDFRSFAACPGVQVAACCDVDSIKREGVSVDVQAIHSGSTASEMAVPSEPG